MPQAIPIIAAIGASAAGAAAAAAGTAGVVLGLGAVAWSAIGVGLSIVGTLAGVLLAPQPPKPKFQDGSQSIKQAVPPRVRCYGRYRLGGAYLDYVGDGGDLKALLCHAAHQIDGIEEHWLNDEVVDVDPESGGAVTSRPYNKYRPEGSSSAYIINYLGFPDQTIDYGMPYWQPVPPNPPEHRGRGLACTYIKFADLGPEKQQEVFPNGPPAYRATLRGARIYDPRPAAGQTAGNEGTYTWSDNAALVILDYLTRTEPGWARDADGNLVPMPIPIGFGFEFSRIDLDSFRAAADVCDQVIPRKSSAYPDERRWRIWGAYELTEDRKTVLSDLLDACGGRLIQGPDGSLGLTVGALDPAADVTITDDQILEYDFSTGKAAIERINEVRATYISQEQGWSEVEAGIQQDQASIDRNGIETSQIKLRFVPAEGQAQRIARYTLKRGNPSWAGRIRGTLALLDAWGERWVRLRLAELGIDQIFEVTSMRLDRTTMSVEMEVTSYDGWWDWNPATDETDPAPVPADFDDDDDMPTPENLSVAIEHRPVNGQNYVAIGVISWDPPSRSVFVGQVRYRLKTPANSPWLLLTAEQDANRVETGALADGQVYQAQARFLGPRRTASEWVPAEGDPGPVEFTAVADPVAPGMPTGLTAQANVPATGQVTVTATQPNDPRAASLRFYRNSSNTFPGGAPLAGPYFSGAGATRSFVDTPGPGDWYYFATSSNWSNVPSAPAGGVLAEVSPPAPVITDPSGPIPSYDRRPPVSGNGAAAGATIKLYANAVQVGTGTAAGDGTWTVTPPADLGLGANSMTATQTVGGNESVASGSVTITVNAIDADAWAYIAAMTLRPPYARQTLIKTLVESLKSAGVWGKLDCLYLLAAHHEQASRLNAKAPGSFALAATTAGSTAPVFTLDRGWQGGGAGATAGGYLACTFNAAGGTHQMQQDSNHLAVWVQQASTANAVGTFREAGGGQLLIACKSSTAVLWTMNMSASADAPAQTGEGTGFHAHSRRASTGYASYQGANSSAITRASSAPASGSFSVLRGGSGFSNARVAAASWGAGLGEAEIAALRNALDDYMAGVGAAA
ncbi:hypothetical protein KXS07_26830 [Inquilinus limosus]|uniref:phage tail protein n=1 Tax=Inquilinus limosus TaxID=171674 RepID=UPI003F161384